MATVSPAGGDYDAYAGQYAAHVAWRERSGPEADPFGLLPPLPDLLCNLGGRRALDAGAARVPRQSAGGPWCAVTGVDI